MLVFAILLLTLSVYFQVGSAKPASEFSALIIGDWGGMPVPPFYTPGQIAAAAGMEKVASQIESEAVFALGDNFYFDGCTNENDKRFKNTFEDVYSGAHLQTPWMVCAGNHDYHGNVTAQIEYSTHSARWTFPNFYHASHFSSTDGSVSIDLIMIDTVDLVGTNAVQDPAQPGYFDALPVRPRSGGTASTQWDWLEGQLKASTATHVIVAGHYPVYSVCEHGPTLTLVDDLKPLLEKYNAHYLSGHDHCLDHINEPGSSVHHILSGVGDTCCYQASNLENPVIPADSVKWYYSLESAKGGASLMRGGFTSMVASASSLVFTHYDQDGNALYTTPSIPPRIVH